MGEKLTSKYYCEFLIDVIMLEFGKGKFSRYYSSLFLKNLQTSNMGLINLQPHSRNVLFKKVTRA